MNKILSILLACTAAGAAYGAQETAQETGQAAKNVAIDSVVVTGARYASDIRHLPMSVAVVDRDEIVRRQEASVLPLLTEQVPGLFVTGRGVTASRTARPEASACAASAEGRRPRCSC